MLIDSLNPNIKTNISILYVATNGKLRDATNGTGAWETFTIDQGLKDPDWPSIALDSNDKMHMSYYDIENGDLIYATNAENE